MQRIHSLGIRQQYNDKTGLKELLGRRYTSLLIAFDKLISLKGADVWPVSGHSGRGSCRLLPRKEAITGAARTRA